MESRDEPGGWRNLTRGAPLAVLLAAGLLIAYKLLPDLELIAIAMLIALVLRSIAHEARRLGAPPWAAAIITLGVIGAAAAFLWFVVLAHVIQQAQMLAAAAPKYLRSLSDLSAQVHSSVGFVPNLSPSVGRLENIFSSLFNSLPLLVGKLTHVTLGAIATVVMALYMTYDPGSLISGFLRLVPTHSREGVKELMDNLGVRLRGWILGTGTAMLVVGGTAGLGLWILGAPLPFLSGFIAGLLEIIPYFGPVVGALLSTLITLAVSPIKALLVVGLFVLIHLADAYFVQPQIMGWRVRLHPVVVIIAFLCLGDLLGFAGLLLAVPTAAFLATLVDEIVSKSPAHKESGKT